MIEPFVQLSEKGWIQESALVGEVESDTKH
jgi:hypothetical protein